MQPRVEDLKKEESFESYYKQLTEKYDQLINFTKQNSTLLEQLKVVEELKPAEEASLKELDVYFEQFKQLLSEIEKYCITQLEEAQKTDIAKEYKKWFDLAYDEAIEKKDKENMSNQIKKETGVTPDQKEVNSKYDAFKEARAKWELKEMILQGRSLNSSIQSGSVTRDLQADAAAEHYRIWYDIRSRFERVDPSEIVINNTNDFKNDAPPNSINFYKELKAVGIKGGQKILLSSIPGWVKCISESESFLDEWKQNFKSMGNLANEKQLYDIIKMLGDLQGLVTTLNAYGEARSKDLYCMMEVRLQLLIQFLKSISIKGKKDPINAADLMLNLNRIENAYNEWEKLEENQKIVSVPQSLFDELQQYEIEVANLVRANPAHKSLSQYHKILVDRIKKDNSGIRVNPTGQLIPELAALSSPTHPTIFWSHKRGVPLSSPFTPVTSFIPFTPFTLSSGKLTSDTHKRGGSLPNSTATPRDQGQTRERRSDSAPVSPPLIGSSTPLTPTGGQVGSNVPQSPTPQQIPSRGITRLFSQTRLMLRGNPSSTSTVNKKSSTSGT